MQLWVFPFCFLFHHLGVSSLASAYRNKSNERSSECVFGFWVVIFFFDFGGWKEGGKGTERICGMGKERREKITLKGKMLK